LSEGLSELSRLTGEHFQSSKANGSANETVQRCNEMGLHRLEHNSLLADQNQDLKKAEE